MIYGAKIIAQALHDLGVQVIFGLPGLPVTDIGSNRDILSYNILD